ncbi:prenyltransferase/squalene oxidase repeat-containing protein [Streptomyces sp. NPDC060205]|uniref:prenyltransferase/squalene oxidase repeat-containing protein n=1 Tax=Streptomyces sp. NPDC060205 TaxID=3347072 RepID=UPI00365A0D60
MFVRRSAAVLAATAVIGTAFAPAALADESPSPSPSLTLPSGLYGSTDPTYDGVWRQSLALLAQHTVGVRPAAKAVDWLTGQQCANGGFAAYRADPAAQCDAKTQIDTNSTGAALQALTALDADDTAAADATAAAVKWLKSVQNEDGGWGYLPGGASDTNSTSVVIGALEAADTDTEDLRSKDDRTPYDALLGLALPCGKGDKAGGNDGGAFAFQPDKKGKLAANADATAAGVLGALGEGLVTDPEDDGPSATPSGNGKAAACAGGDSPTPEQAAANGAAYLAGAVAETGYLESALAGAEDQPDYGNTADTVVALAAAGRGADTGKPLTWLEKNSASWAAESGPAAYAQLIFAAHATGTDPRNFGGADLVKQLGATGPAAEPAAKDGKDDEQAAEDANEDDGGVSVWWIVGVGLVGGIGVGFLLSTRTKKQQQP